MLQFTERARHSQLGVEDAEERSICFSNEYLTILSNLNTNPTQVHILWISLIYPLYALVL